MNCFDWMACTFSSFFHEKKVTSEKEFFKVWDQYIAPHLDKNSVLHTNIEELMSVSTSLVTPSQIVPSPVTPSPVVTCTSSRKRPSSTTPGRFSSPALRPVKMLRTTENIPDSPESPTHSDIDDEIRKAFIGNYVYTHFICMCIFGSIL